MNHSAKFASETSPQKCERCDEYFARELIRRTQSPFQKKFLVCAKTFLAQLASITWTCLIVIGNTLFFLVAMWFVPHSESPTKRRQRLLDEAFKRRKIVRDERNGIEATHNDIIALAVANANDALNRGMKEIAIAEDKARKDNYDWWCHNQHIFRYREETLRKRVEECFQNDLAINRSIRDQYLDENWANANAAEEQYKRARRGG